jgi:hypothetical protein
MALRLLPFRQYNEHDVVNLFTLDDNCELDSTTGDGAGSNGVFVKISSGDFNQDTVKYTSNNYLGNTDYPFIGGDMYPVNPLKVRPANSGEIPLGLTLNQTAKTDENGEKLLYNATKREELQAVLIGQTVPVATKGVFTLSKNAIAPGAAAFTVGGGFEIAAGGEIGPAAVGSASSLGMVLGTGSRVSQGGLTDQFAGDYVIVKLG